jgi:hypothetical protein
MAKPYHNPPCKKCVSAKESAWDVSQVECDLSTERLKPLSAYQGKIASEPQFRSKRIVRDPSRVLTGDKIKEG